MDKLRQQNPVRALRESRALTQDDMALICRVSVSTVRIVERGGMLALSPKWRPGIEAMGADFEELKAAYAAWLDACAREATEINQSAFTAWLQK